MTNDEQYRRIAATCGFALVPWATGGPRQDGYPLIRRVELTGVKVKMERDATPEEVDQFLAQFNKPMDESERKATSYWSYGKVVREETCPRCKGHGIVERELTVEELRA